MDNFKIKSAAFALKEMFKGNSYDICTVRDACEVLGLPKHGGELNTLRLYHCVKFTDMDAETRQEVFKRTMGLFSQGPLFDLDAIDKGFGISAKNEVAQQVSGETSNVRKLRWFK